MHVRTRQEKSSIVKLVNTGSNYFNCYLTYLILQNISDVPLLSEHMEATSWVSGSSLHVSEKPGKLPKAISSRLTDKPRFRVSKNSPVLGKTSSTSIKRYKCKT